MTTPLKLENHWYIAAPSAALRNRPIRRFVEGEPLVLFRDGAGQAKALRDRCAHRGMALSAGRVVGDCVECPYHGWRYDGSGQLCAVPALSKGEKMPRAVSMRAYPTSEQDGQIWVWIGDREPSGPPFHFPFCGEAGWTTFFMQTRFAAPVEACLENFLDVPHTLFVHPGLFRGQETRETRVRIQREGGSAWAEFLDEQPLEGWGPRLIAPNARRVEHTDRFILPAITRVDYGFGDRYRFIITSQCTRREGSTVDVTTAITWRLRLPGWLLKPFLRLYCRRVIQQDVAVLKIQGRQIERFGPVAFHTRADLLGKHILRLRRHAAKGGEALPPLCDEVAITI